MNNQQTPFQNRVTTATQHDNNYLYIETDKMLDEMVKTIINGNGSVALDTEFIRIDTFYQRLGLIQLNSCGVNYLIDPLKINEWEPFISLLATDLEFYFHALGEDVELLSVYFEQLPHQIVDTQIFASFLDNPISASYSTLLDKYLGIQIDKSETRTDWLARPLSKNQLSYAVDDVHYLPELVQCLKTELAEKGWLDAAYEETNAFIQRRLAKRDIDDSYLSIKEAWKLNGSQLAYLKILAKWRMEVAQKENRALSFVLKDEVLINLSKERPKSKAQLEQIGMRGKEIRLYGEQVIALLSEEREPISKIHRTVDYADYKQYSSEIKKLADKAASETGLNRTLIVSKRHINEYVEWKHHPELAKPELISGWRADYFKALAE